MATATTTLPITPSRASRFTSVKDMLLLTDDLEVSLSPPKSINPPSTKLKRPNKSAILSRKSTNSPSLLSKNGKIFGKATKPSSISNISKPKTIDSFDVFAIPSSQPEEGEEETKEGLLETPPKETKDLCIPAKRLWTPVKENARPEVIDLCTPDDVAKATATGSFVSLLSSYKNQDVPKINGLHNSTSCGEPLRKGRCIGLVNIPGSRKSSLTPLAEEQQNEVLVSKVTEKAASKSKKPKAKKGAKTITGLAVAPYLPADVESPALQTLSEAPVEEPAEEQKPKKPRKKRETSTTKTPKPKKVSKKSEVQPPLLSPKSVQKQMDTQSFIFGTSSQLLRTDPPEGGWALEMAGQKLNTIQTHAKIHAKARWDLDNFSDAEKEVVEKPLVQSECAVDTSGWGISDLDITKVKRKSGMGIWSVGSRGLSGELHSVEVMDLVDEDDLDDILSQRVSSQQPKAASSKVQKDPKPQTKEAVKENTAPLIPKDLPAVRWTQLPTPDSTNPGPESSKPKPKKTDETTKPTGLSDRPNFEGFTMIQLQIQIKQYGYKPVKSRKTMIDILNKCWDSAEIMIANPPSPVVIKPKTVAKGKGKKKPAADGEAEVVPKKRGRRPKATAEPEDEMEAPKSKRRKSSTVAPTKKLDTSTVFKHIAAAIKQQPTSPDLRNPSWWQRILVNETIVLEEFSKWLLDSGLQAAGVDESIWVDCGVCDSSTDADSTQKKEEVVKLWCEARSVSFVERGGR
ncbi:5'-flap endonuclease [Orbilia oligospora]|uniref:Structure-specific endonuclease subunit SLX4 n=1 Tax=Orbilia oligospora TaxID=2813651 RepID=A0A7C8KQG8_ORBOL|nr:5'-flap endonuclease [Orbilia oligospora]